MVTVGRRVEAPPQPPLRHWHDDVADASDDSDEDDHDDRDDDDDDDDSDGSESEEDFDWDALPQHVRNARIAANRAPAARAQPAQAIRRDRAPPMPAERPDLPRVWHDRHHTNEVEAELVLAAPRHTLNFLGAGACLFFVCLLVVPRDGHAGLFFQLIACVLYALLGEWFERMTEERRRDAPANSDWWMCTSSFMLLSSALFDVVFSCISSRSLGPFRHARTNVYNFVSTHLSENRGVREVLAHGDIRARLLVNRHVDSTQFDMCMRPGHALFVVFVCRLIAAFGTAILMRASWGLGLTVRLSWSHSIVGDFLFCVVALSCSRLLMPWWDRSHGRLDVSFQRELLSSGFALTAAWGVGLLLFTIILASCSLCVSFVGLSLTHWFIRGVAGVVSCAAFIAAVATDGEDGLPLKRILVFTAGAWCWWCSALDASAFFTVGATILIFAYLIGGPCQGGRCQELIMIAMFAVVPVMVFVSAYKSAVPALVLVDVVANATLSNTTVTSAAAAVEMAASSSVASALGWAKSAAAFLWSNTYSIFAFAFRMIRTAWFEHLFTEL